MKLAPNRILRSLGYEIRRIPPRARQHARPDPEETAALDQILRRFIKHQPDASACSDIRELRKYLSDSRLAFFQEVIYLCHRHHINLDAKRIADVGSGTGYLLRMVHQAAPTAKLAGYDTFGEMMALAKLLCPVASLEVRDLFQLDDKFDVIFCTEILEHLEQPGQALRTLAKLVLPGGALLLTVPDGRKDQQESGARREDGTAYWGHIHFWSPESWRLFLDRELGAHYRIESGQVATGDNYGIVFPMNKS